MEEVLRNLNKEPGVTGSAVVSKDGLVIASTIDRDDDSVAGLVASIFQNTGAASDVMSTGAMDMITLEGDTGKAILVNLSEALLVILTAVDVNLGRLRVEIRRAVSLIHGWM